MLIVTVVGMGTTGKAAEPPIIKLGSTYGFDYPTSQVLPYFQMELAQLTAGQVSIQLFPNGQLGMARDLVAGLQFGNIELAVLSTETLAAVEPGLAPILLPFLWRDDAHRFHALDGPIGRQLLDTLTHNNLIGLGFLESGTQSLIATQRPIVTPEDVRDLAIGRLNDCLVCQASFLNATLLPMAKEAIPEAFQNKRITAWEGTEAEYLDFNLSAFGAIFLTSTRHRANPDVLVASKRWFDSLTPETQQALYKAARLTILRQRELWAAFMQAASVRLEQAGVQFTTIDRAAWLAAVQPFYTQMTEQFGPEFAELLATIHAVK